MPRVFLHFEPPTSLQIVALQTDFPPMSLQAILTAHSLAARPTYILYATQDEEKSFLLVAQRLEKMQIRQMEALLGLNSSQITQVMTDARDQYAGRTGDSPSQMMRLPIMALLMGTWFPQKAKEESASTPPPF